MATLWRSRPRAVAMKKGSLCGLPWLAVAGLPIAALGLRVFHGVSHQPPGPAFNRLLAMGGVLLLLFAVAFQLAALAGDL